MLSLDESKSADIVDAIIELWTRKPRCGYLECRIGDLFRNPFPLGTVPAAKAYCFAYIYPRLIITECEVCRTIAYRVTSADRTCHTNLPDSDYAIVARHLIRINIAAVFGKNSTTQISVASCDIADRYADCLQSPAPYRRSIRQERFPLTMYQTIRAGKAPRPY